MSWIPSVAPPPPADPGSPPATEAELQSQRMLADRMITIGALAAGVAHEINTPLTCALTNLEFLAESMERGGAPANDQGDELRAVVHDAMEGARRVSQIVQQLKKLSRKDDGEPGAIDLHAVLESAAMLCRNEVRHRARLVRDYRATWPVLGHEARLGQVFVNLIVNAAQALPDDRAADSQITLRTRDTRREVEVDVIDTGGGISDAVLPRIFEAFFTTKPAGVGSGLGLAICREILHEMGGSLALVSTRPGETIFRVTLPRAPGPPTPVPPAPRRDPSEARARVLVVDDDPAVGRSLKRLLRGHDVEVASDGRHALGMLVSGRDFDVVLCDLMMPDFDGVDLYGAVARICPEAAGRFVFMTGGAFTSRAREFLDGAKNPTLPKPFTSDEAREVVEASLHALR